MEESDEYKSYDGDEDCYHEHDQELEEDPQIYQIEVTPQAMICVIRLPKVNMMTTLRIRMLRLKNGENSTLHSF